MTRRSWYRFFMLALAGGTVFQATAGCKDQLLDSFTTSVIPMLSSVLTTAITTALQNGITT